MGKENVPKLFPITIYEKLDTDGIITKARARIFYKYGNRNGSYITDDYADHLLKTLPGSPVKGIYDHQEDDYTDHGSSRTQGRAYGFVPETNHNISYEKHVDEDGIERTYACADVYLWTALYEEAVDILGSAQSMELYEPSIKGSWEVINGQRYFVYTEGSFLGLQVLGDDTEPCFEGAAFFSLLKDFPQDFLQSLYDSFLKFQQKSLEGEKGMDKQITFKLSDAQKENKIFQTLNEAEYRYYVHSVYDNYAVVYDYKLEQFGKVSYQKNDMDDTVTVSDDMTQVFPEWLTQSERSELNVLRSLKLNYEIITEDLEKDFDSYEKELEEAVRKNEEGDTTISTLTQEKEEIETSLSTLQEEKNELEEELEGLRTYKLEIELKEKKQVLDRYAEHLDGAVIEDYLSKIDEFTKIDLDKELAYVLTNSKPELFTKTPGYTPKDEELNGLDALLSQYKKN